jgi:hypothetical protein
MVGDARSTQPRIDPSVSLNAHLVNSAVGASPERALVFTTQADHAQLVSAIAEGTLDAVFEGRA